MYSTAVSRQVESSKESLGKVPDDQLEPNVGVAVAVALAAVAVIGVGVYNVIGHANAVAYQNGVGWEETWCDGQGCSWNSTGNSAALALALPAAELDGETRIPATHGDENLSLRQSDAVRLVTTALAGRH